MAPRWTEAKVLSVLRQRFGPLSHEVALGVGWLVESFGEAALENLDGATSPEAFVFCTAAQRLRRDGYLMGFIEGFLGNRFGIKLTQELEQKLSATNARQLKAWAVQLANVDSPAAALAVFDQRAN